MQFTSTPEIAGAAAFCIIVLEKSLNFAAKLRNGKNGNGISEMRAAFRDDLRSVLMERGICSNLQEIRDSVNRLVTLTERR